MDLDLTLYPQDVRDAYARARNDDPSAMFEMGKFNERLRDGVTAARQWYDAAAGKGHVPALHALARLAATAEEYEQARAYLGRIAREAGGSDLVSIASDIFDRQGEAYGDGGWAVSPAFLVISPDAEDAALALHHASRRVHLVGEDGTEFADWEVTDVYTPNLVSEVFLSEAGAWIYTDTKGEMSSEMGETMVRVLSEELARARVRAHVTAPRVDESTEKVWSPPTEDTAGEAVDSPRMWFIGRSERRVTLDGRHYLAMRYRRADGEWSEHRTVAEQFSEPPLDLINDLRAQAPPRGGPGTTGLFLPVSDDALWSLPPTSIRGTD